MDLPSLFRRDPAGLGTAFGLLLVAAFVAAPAALPLFLALGAAAVLARPDRAALNGLAVGALVGLAAAKGLVETAGLGPRDGFTGLPWIAAVACATVPLLVAATTRRHAGPNPAT